MSVAPSGILSGFSKGEVRQLVELQQVRLRVHELMKERDRCLTKAEAIQKQIEVVLGRAAIESHRTARPKRTRPTVKEMAIEILKRRTRGLTAAQVRREILKKYPDRDKDTFYNQVYIALTRCPEFKRMKDKVFTLTTEARRNL